MAWRSNVAPVADVSASGRRYWVRGLPKGFPDISGLLPAPRLGVALFVECKSLRGTLSPEQQAFHARLRAHGAVVLTIKSIPDLREGLRAEGLSVP